jgi:hypothetical protein
LKLGGQDAGKLGGLKASELSGFLAYSLFVEP